MKRILLFAFIVLFFKAFPQWTAKNPFEQKVFIENKGQYALKDKATKEEILFGARQDGLQYYFTKNSIYIKHTSSVKRSEPEIEAEIKRLGIKEEAKAEEKEFAFKQVEEFHQLNFVGAGNQTEILSAEKISHTYNFGVSANQTIIANAFKKITYKNLYPGIDMEFYFPEDKQGFKYNFILQPGADASQIKMQYPLSEKVKISGGNVTIKSLFGDFTDHAPVATQGTNAIDCSFKPEKNNAVGFSISSYDKTQSLIIDPWTTTPIFAGSSNAYDVDWDYAGNCYAYGGISPFQLIKFNNSGVPQWVFTTSTFASSSGGAYYGDFTIDKASSSIYIVDGFNSTGAQMLKVNNSGVQTLVFPGNNSLQEMWRVSFDLCNRHPVIAGGGTTNPSYTGCTLDTNLQSVNPVNIINAPNGLHDMWGLAVDVSGNAYFATAKTQVGTPGFDNYIFRVPNPSLTPITFSVATTYDFVEVASVTYANNANGFNGMAVSDTNLFAYDSYVLTRFSTISGLQTGALNINGASLSSMTYGGLTTDGCGNLFLGLNNSIKQYDANFNYLSTLSAAGMVYDVNLGNGLLYSCGQGFVSATTVSLTICNPCSGGTTQVNNFVKNNTEFSIYPNPTSNNVNIEFVELPKNTKITLYNAMGQKLQSQTVNQKTITLSMEVLPEGVYMVEVYSNEKTSVHKLIKANH